MSAINTLVFGSPITADQMADGLDSAGDRLRSGNGKVSSGVNTAEACWEGTAHNTFVTQSALLPKIYDKVLDTTTRWSRGLRDWSGSIRKVQQGFHEILDRAGAGQLPVRGALVLPPERPWAGMHSGSMQCPVNVPANVSAQAHKEYTDAQAQLQRDIDEYNRKLALYNELLARARDLRKQEEQAHLDLRKAFQETPLPNGLGLVVTSASGARTVVAGFQGVRQEELRKMGHLRSYGNALQKFTSGDIPNPGMRAKIEEVMSKQNAQEERVKVVRNWGKNLDKLNRLSPQFLDHITAGPGNPERSGVNNYGSRMKGPSQLSKTLRNVSWAGSGLTAFNQGLGAMRGEQTWTKAGVNTVSSIGVGAAAARARTLVVGEGASPKAKVGGTLLLAEAGDMIRQDVIKGWEEGTAEKHVDDAFEPLPYMRHQ